MSKRGLLVVVAPLVQLLREPAGRQQPHQPDPDHHRDHDRRPAGHLPRAVLRRAEDVVQLQPDQAEGHAGDQHVDDLPEGVTGEPPQYVVGVARVLGQEQGRREHGQHPRALELLRHDVRDEGHQQRQPDLQGGVTEQAHEPVGGPAEREPDGHGHHGGEHELPERVGPGEAAADDCGDGHVVQHDGRHVVEESLALQDRHHAAGEPQRSGDGGGGHRVGRGDERAERDGGSERQTGHDGVGHGGHGRRGDEHQGHGQQQDGPDVGRELPPGGALHGGVQQRRQHQRQDELGRDLDVRHRRHQREDHPADGHEDRRGQFEPVPERHRDHGPEEEHEQQS
ncbi:hypothetical protein SAVIM40S_02653 [Streptomyces avidinii]